MNPETLYTLSRRIVNGRVRCHNGVNKLNIPSCLKKDLHHNYLEDRLRCCETLNFPSSLEDFVQAISFDEPFMDVDVNSFLKLQTWSDVYPEFCFEDNIVHFTWYETIRENIRMCKSCAKNVTGQMLVEVSNWERIPGRVIVDEVIQARTSWCEKCTTTTLFCFINKEDWFGLVPSYSHIIRVVTSDSDPE